MRSTLMMSIPSSVVPGGTEAVRHRSRYSTVTDLARLRGWSTSVPRATAMWYANSWSGMMARTGLSASCVSGTQQMSSA